jgi:hypothetical protein
MRKKDRAKIGGVKFWVDRKRKKAVPTNWHLQSLVLAEEGKKPMVSKTDKI